MQREWTRVPVSPVSWGRGGLYANIRRPGEAGGRISASETRRRIFTTVDMSKTKMKITHDRVEAKFFFSFLFFSWGSAAVARLTDASPFHLHQTRPRPRGGGRRSALLSYSDLRPPPSSTRTCPRGWAGGWIPACGAVWKLSDRNQRLERLPHKGSLSLSHSLFLPLSLSTWLA